MPSDFPQFIWSILIGTAIGLLLSAVILFRRWLRGEPLFPKRPNRGVPLKTWILGTVAFGAGAIGGFLSARYSFAAFCGIAALLYTIGLTRFLLNRRRQL